MNQKALKYFIFHAIIKVMNYGADATINKLILLFVFDKMEIPLVENTIMEMCCVRNNWLTYMDCKQAMAQLIDANFIYNQSEDKTTEQYYTITPDGRMCLAHFFVRIPSTTRNNIVEYIKDNRMSFRRRQEYFRDYQKNADGTYTVLLRISDPVQSILELKLNVANRHTAKWVYDKWDEKAAQVYSALHELLIE